MAMSVKRIYKDFRGVDFSNEASLVDIRRSPDALNIWKNYREEQGNCIETRPGYFKLGTFGEKINGFYVFNNKALIHAGNKLYLWKNFPDNFTNKDIEKLKEDMNNQRSSFVIHDNKLYILDGLNYLVYYNDSLKDVSDDNPYIPTTTIARRPLGGGEQYQDINLLTSKRKNSFLADGKSTDYYLDAQDIDSVIKVMVDDKDVTDYTVNKAMGKVTFTTAPSAPTLSNDNVVITFSKNIEGYKERIQNCSKMINFDNRIFYTGNEQYKNGLFHCALEDPEYISDLAYYQDGSDDSAIKQIVVGNNVLWVFKEPNQSNDTIFYHTTATYSTGRVYPNYQGNVSIGCYSDAINYRDDIVFLSKQGLEAVTMDSGITSKQIINHRSSLVDNKLINENNYNLAMMSEWEGYLLILVDKKIYLADMRQMYSGLVGYEYEWYYWDFKNIQPSYIKEYQGDLYIGSEDGTIYIMQGTNDDGYAIESYWTTILDNFGYNNMNKTTNKRGGCIKIKNIPNGKIKIGIITNEKKKVRDIKEVSLSGFDYSDIEYSNFSYSTDDNTDIVYKVKEKKFLEIALRFYSNEIDRPFGVYSATLEAFIGGYTKK